ncbi:MAG: NADP-dependent oxidoreductase [Deltaproteobacteria bacterium]|nr:NADP-dependent oxidoreductase [Deltaproteobacteria bacterium]
MKAVRVHTYGGAEKMIPEEVKRPVIGDDELLVRVHAAGVNPVDWKVREGYLHDFLGLRLPFIPGYDLSGVVEETGAAVEDFQPGDPVFALLNLSRPGAYAEYAVVKDAEAVSKPDSLNHAQAAAVPLAALTAWQCLFDMAGLQSGQKVLIHAAAGGVGHFAVQLARWVGAHVIATASAANLDFLRRIGAHQVIDYHTVRFEKLTGEVDVVLDLLSGETRERSWPLLRKHGILVTTLPPEPEAEVLARYQVRGAAMLVKPDSLQLGEIAQLIDSGRLRPEVKAFPFAQFREANQQSQTGHVRGKLVLVVRE